MFIDKVAIEVKAGGGGDGAVAFRREKYVPAGGPAGGDGGHGGSVIVVADSGLHTLMDFRYRRHYKAERGENGRNKKQYGKKGDDLYLKVPVGTLIKDRETDTVIKDMHTPGEAYTIAKGGRGGRGNIKFASSTRRAPRFAEPGRKGEEKSIVLELKMIADVGLVGLPNVGKSTLLSVLSDAKPKIANYHFTTLQPNLGVVRIGPGEDFVVADIPGLIEGASEGAGLGLDFLRHIERTRMLVHIVDASGHEGRDPVEDFHLIMKELAGYSEKLAGKPMLLAANKTDLPGAENHLERIRALTDDGAIFPISAATRVGIEPLKYAMYEALKELPEDYETFDAAYIPQEDSTEVPTRVERVGNKYVVTGSFIERLVYRTDFSDYEATIHFQDQLKRHGIIEELKAMGIKEADTVVLDDIEFEFME